MRRFNRLKLFSDVGVSYKRMPRDLSRFHRPKWRIPKRRVVHLFKERFKFLDLTVKKLALRMGQRVKQHYKMGFLSRRILNSLFDWGFDFGKERTNLKNKRERVSALFVRPLYKIDILLWYLGFFQSLYQARQFIDTGKIWVNGVRVCSSYMLKGGDIIFLGKDGLCCSNLISRLNKYSSRQPFFTFLEMDYYTKTIVIIRSYQDLTFEDLNLLI